MAATGAAAPPDLTPTRMRHYVAILTVLLASLYIAGAGYQLGRLLLPDGGNVPVSLEALEISPTRYEAARQILKHECLRWGAWTGARFLLAMLALYGGLLSRTQRACTRVLGKGPPPAWATVGPPAVVVLWSLLWCLPEAIVVGSPDAAGTGSIVRYLFQVAKELVWALGLVVLHRISPSRRAAFVIGISTILAVLLAAAEMDQHGSPRDRSIPPLSVATHPNCQAIGPLLAAEQFPPDRLFLRPLEGAYYSRGLRDETICIGGPLFHTSSPAELAAIVAHELGHRALHHFWMGLARATVSPAVNLALSLFLLDPQPRRFDEMPVSPLRDALLAAFGGDGSLGLVRGLCVSLALAALVDWLWRPVNNWISQTGEFAADRFAADRCGRKALMAALSKVPGVGIYSASRLFQLLYWGHPSVPYRIARVLAAEGGGG